MTGIGIFAALTAGFIMGYVYRARGFPYFGKWKSPFMGTRQEFGIAVTRTNNILDLQNDHKVVMTRHDVKDLNALYVADPFLIYDKDCWHMFMEVVKKAGKRGEIGTSVSSDGVHWDYQGIVIKENFHLSYPYVFKHKDNIYMIPETKADHSVRLYRALDFPRKWHLEKKLLEDKPFTDPSIFRAHGMFWLFVSCNNSHDLLLYFAKNLMGPWQCHPKSPIAYFEPKKARCAGRVVRYQDNLIRFAQDCETVYGRAVYAFKIIRITPLEYLEEPLFTHPLLKGSGQGWNADGMHHIDLHQLDNNSYLAALDGYRTVKSFGIRF